MRDAPQSKRMTRRHRPILSWRLRQWLCRLAARPVRAPGVAELHLEHLQKQRIGLVKWDAIGDFVLATTLLRLVHRELNPGRVTLFCRDPVAALARNQFPDWQVVVLPPRLSPLRRIYLQPGTRRLLKAEPPFDLLVDLRAMRDMGDSVLTSWIPARTKIGLANQYELPGVGLAGEAQLYNRLYSAPAAEPGESGACRDIQNYRFLAALLFPSTPGTDRLWPLLEVQEGIRQEVVGRLAREHNLKDPFLLVCPGSLDPIKEYPPARLALAISEVVGRRPLPVVLAGSMADVRTTRPLRAALAGMGGVYDLTGQFDLVGHAALIMQARVVLCMDSGTAHMAGALGRPAVAILGGGQPGVFAPWGPWPTFRWLRHPLPCYGCNWQCIHDRPVCIEDVSPETIARNLLEMLEG